MEPKSAETTITYSDEELAQRVSLLTELLQCSGKLYVSRYNSSGTLMETNSPNMIYDTFLRSTKLLDEAISFTKTSTKPLILTADLGIMWAVIYRRDDVRQLLHLYTLGPIFCTALSEESICAIQKKTTIREKWKPKLIQYLKKIPVIAATDFFKYTLMLHYSVNGVYLKPSDITFSSFQQQGELSERKKKIDYAEYWARENAMVQIIKTGDIYYKNKLPSASSFLQDLYPESDSELEELRQFATIFTGLCIRGAIDGGVSPNTAYVRGNVYLKNLLAAKSFADVLSSCHSLFDDFLFQVHNHQGHLSYSEIVNSCIDFIETHTDEPLNIDYLAARLNYSKYYLSKRFKSETGMTVNSYIKKARIDHACYLLVTSTMDIQDISDLLHFGNRNFFTKVFKDQTGYTPAVFRSNHKRPL